MGAAAKKDLKQISKVKSGCIDAPKELEERRFDPEKHRVKMGSSSQDQDIFNLRWNDFQANVSSAFRDMRNDPDYSDVRLAVKDNAIPLKAHKVVLSSCSPYFKELLKQMKNDNQTMALSPYYIMMRGVTSSALNGILDFMYYGEVKVAREDLNELLSLADELQVKGLSKKGQQGGSNASAAATLTPSKRHAAPPVTAAMPSTTHSASKGARTTPIPTTSTNTSRIVKTEAQDTPIKHQEQDDDFDECEEGAEEGVYRGAEGAEGFNDDPGEGTSAGGRAVNYGDNKDAINEGIEKQGSKYVCLVCGLKTVAKYHANVHFRTKHTSQPKAVCQLCQKVCQNSDSRNNHLRRTHGCTMAQIRKMLMEGEGTSEGPKRGLSIILVA